MSNDKKDDHDPFEKLMMKEEKLNIHPSQYLLYAGLTSHGKFGSDLIVKMRQMGPNVNHGVRQEAVIADICNNFLGNPARLQDLPAPRMQNDMMSVQLTSMVSDRQLGKNKTIPRNFLCTEDKKNIITVCLGFHR